jgi:hypothetical protein
VAKKRGNGEVYDLTVEILKSIREELRGVRTEVIQLREEMRAELRGVNARLDGTNARIDNLIEFSGERWRDHEQRLRRLERRR